MSPYREGEDIQSFLSNFERVMHDEEVEREDWAKHLFKLLEGSARQAVDDSREEQDYDEIGEMLQRFFNVTDESNRKLFRNSRWNTKVPPEQHVRLMERQFKQAIATVLEEAIVNRFLLQVTRNWRRNRTEIRKGRVLWMEDRWRRGISCAISVGRWDTMPGNARKATMLLWSSNSPNHCIRD